MYRSVNSFVVTNAEICQEQKRFEKTLKALRMTQNGIEKIYNWLFIVTDKQDMIKWADTERKQRIETQYIEKAKKIEQTQKNRLNQLNLTSQKIMKCNDERKKRQQQNFDFYQKREMNNLKSLALKLQGNVSQNNISVMITY